MNMVVLQGRMAGDPEGGESGQGIAFAKFSIAIERGSGDAKQTSFLDCVAFRQSADFVRKYFSKGDGINVVGSISVKDWEDPQTGTKRRKFEIIASQVSFPISKARTGATSRPQTAPRNGDRAPVGAGVSSEYDGY